MKKYFSLKKYTKWCKKWNLPITKWPYKCAGKEVIDGLCEGYQISDLWVIEK